MSDKEKSEKDMSEVLPVLVVEDEELLLSFLKTALERGGVKVVGAASGSEALGLLERGEFAGVVSDLRMPGRIGGAEIFDWVRQNRPALSSRFLFITGNVSDPYAIETRERTGALFIEKPFRIALLIELINKITARDGSRHMSDPRPIRLLIVDDQQSIRQSVRGHRAKDGIGVLAGGERRGGAGADGSRCPDLMLTDLVLGKQFRPGVAGRGEEALAAAPKLR